MRFGYLVILILIFVSCKQKNDTSKTTFPKFHKAHNLWTGSKVKNKIQYICGIEFDYKDSLNIEYRLTFLEDWVQKKELFGKAQFAASPSIDSINIIAFKDTFKVFCFHDRTNNLRILFSNFEKYAPMLAKVQYLQLGNWKDTTMVMHQK